MTTELNQIWSCRWIAMKDEHPPYGEYVLVFAAAKEGWMGLSADYLAMGVGPKEDPALCYWISHDFDEVTHWSPLPPVPGHLQQPEK